MKINGKTLHGGTFKPKDSTPEEVERARLAAVESRRKLEEKSLAHALVEEMDITLLKVFTRAAQLGRQLFQKEQRD